MSTEWSINKNTVTSLLTILNNTVFQFTLQITTSHLNLADVQK